MNKSVTCAQAVEMIPDGASVMVGGFMASGVPLRLIDELVRQNKKNLTVITNDPAWPNVAVGKLFHNKQVKKFIGTFIGLNPEAQKMMISGEVESEVCPQGTFVERIRSGGFGLGGVLTPTGVGTVVAEGKQTVEVDGKTFLLEKPLRADFALIGAHRVDYLGNTEYLLTSRNFNVAMATAADTVIVDADEIVPTGVIPPDMVVTPFVCVDYIVEKERS